MKVAFADTSFYQALLNPKDNWHDNAADISNAFRGKVVTSEYVLCELGALMSHGYLRQDQDRPTHFDYPEGVT